MILRYTIVAFIIACHLIISGGKDVSNIRSDLADNYGIKFYHIAKRIRSSLDTTRGSLSPSLPPPPPPPPSSSSRVLPPPPPSGKENAVPRIHIIRIPKAYSSFLSTMARRFVGCDPPGPCCRYPGDPIGSCPSDKLIACEDEKRVIGCTSHHPDLDYLYDHQVISVSMIRDPYNRSLSAFFYEGNHHNSDCKKTLVECFKDYCQSNRWRNIAVKMLTGSYAYSIEETCYTKQSCRRSLALAKDNLQYFTTMGIAEMWELSILLMYVKIPAILPQLSEISPSVGNKTLQNNKDNHNGNLDNGSKAYTMRARSQEKETIYGAFKKIVFSNPSLFKLLQHQNDLDVLLYYSALELLCTNLHAYGLWDYPVVRKYWREKSPRNIKKCS